MTRPARLITASLALLVLGGWAPSKQDNPAPASPTSILWSRTWEGALREAKIRNTPIYILVSIGEG